MVEWAGRGHVGNDSPCEVLLRQGGGEEEEEGRAGVVVIGVVPLRQLSSHEVLHVQPRISQWPKQFVMVHVTQILQLEVDVKGLATGSVLRNHLHSREVGQARTT